MAKTTLLCPTDFSRTSDRALEYAVGLATQLGGGAVRLLHVHHVPLHDVDVNAPHRSADLDTDLRRNLERRLGELAAAHKTPAVAIDTELRVGTPWREILAAAGALGPDMIVMGTLGHTGLARLLLGSVAERVVRMSDRPVVTVRATDEEGSS